MLRFTIVLAHFIQDRRTNDDFVSSTLPPNFVAIIDMRIHVVAPLITLLSLVGVNAEIRDHDCHYAGEPPCHCGPKFHLDVALMDASLTHSFCSGTIINKKQVLTLAECVSGRNREDYKVVVKLANGAPEVAYIVRYVIYNSKPLHPSRDLAIVNIDQEFDVEHLTGAVCLPFCFPREQFDDQKSIFTGFRRNPDSRKIALIIGVVTLTLNGSCINDDEYLNSRSLCIEKPEPYLNDFVAGQPIFWEIEDNLLMQIGIILLRTSADGKKVPVVLRLGPFVNWIEKHGLIGFEYCKLR